MKTRSFGEPFVALSIALPFLVAASVVLRTLAAYWGHDGLAGTIVVAIGGALVLGFLELAARVLRATQLERELRSLPQTPDERAVDSASPLLASMLRARIEHAPLPQLSEGIAPFLSALMVMLGLLGTLLGLFQTVRGAGHALVGSADVEALRHSLSAPIEGLTRSFGCSAAGISASAMLGLAVALVRRREARVWKQFHAYAAGPLRALTASARQVRALERLAGQNVILPEAAGTLERVGTQLTELSTQLVSLQQTAIKAQQRAFSDLLASVRGEFNKAAGEIGEALHARVSPLLEQLATRSGEALVAQAGALGDVMRGVTQELEKDAAARREHALEAQRALDERLTEHERTRTAAHAEGLALLQERAQSALREAEQRERTLSERWDQLTQRFDAQLEAAERSERERLRSVEEMADAARASEHERGAALESLTTRVGSELSRLSGTLAAELELRSARDQQAEQSLQQLAAAATTLEESVKRQERALEECLSGQTRALEQSVARQEGALQECLSGQTRALEQSVARQERAIEDNVARQTQAIERSVAQQERTLAEALERRADSEQQNAARIDALLEGALTGQAGALERSVTRQEAALSESAARHMAALEQSVGRFENLLERTLAGQSEALGASASRQEGALTQLVERLPALFERRADEAQRAAEERVTTLVESTDQRLSHISGLLAEEATRRSESAAAFDARAFAALEAVDQTRSLIEGALSRQSAELESLVARVAALLPDLADAAQAGAARTLAELREHADAQAQRFAALEAALQRGRESHLAELAERLNTHADDLEQRLARTGGAVEEAAASWQASSAEMQAVADLFARSIERQREASDAWLENLGEVEGAALRAGQDAARDALADQLVATQEVFARQLQFQRELFEQLRALRGPTRAGALNGEHDVSL
jgi:hypothetical protein